VSCRRIPAAIIGALTVLVLVAASMAPMTAASARPSVALDPSVDGASATITVDINRAPHQIATCSFVLDGSASATCGPATATAKKASRYSLHLTSQTAGAHTVTVTVVLTDRGKASRTASFTIVADDTHDIDDADGDGVPDATDNCPTVANAGQANQYGSAKGDACEDTDGDGTLDVNEANICVSVDGVVIVSPADSTATCFSDRSSGASANIAIADGDGAMASAYDGDDNTATAIGDGAVAQAFTGRGNTATASSHSSAAAYDGDDNTATASGDGAIAAAYGGHDNTATASGDGSLAVAHALTGCTVTNGMCP